MPNLIQKNLRSWIAASESWSTFMDLVLPKENMANYPFLNRSDEFYISLFGKFFEIINSDNINNYDVADLVAIARALEMFSLEKTKNEFYGVNADENILYSASLYYLADFSASAHFLTSNFSLDKFNSNTDRFILYFLKRRGALSNFNYYIYELDKFLKNGNNEILINLADTFLDNANKSYYHDVNTYISNRLAYFLIKKFIDSNTWQSLLEQKNDINFWKPFVRKNLLNRPVPVWDFFPSQRQAISEGLLSDGISVSLRMPTSSGKTALAELIIFYSKKTNTNNKILFLAPFRALASELKGNLIYRLSKVGIKSKVIYGGNSATTDETIALENVDLLISTPEKFLSIESLIPDIYDNFQTIICDEGHLLNDEQRGLNYELLLSRLKNNYEKKFIFISAIVPNLEDINKWLGGETSAFISSSYRPTDLDFAFLVGENGYNYSLDVNPTHSQPKNYKLYKFLTKEDFGIKEKKDGKDRAFRRPSQKSLSAITAIKSVSMGPVAVFCAQKGGNSGVMELSNEVYHLFQKPGFTAPIAHSKDASKISELKEYFVYIFGEDYLLSKVVDYGFVYHHGDLPQFTREIIEDYFRRGIIQLIICTSTLAEGVNLPIKVMVLHSVKRFNGDKAINISIRDIKNITGRAGRAGKETKGFIIATNPKDYLLLRQVIQNNDDSKIKGQLYEIISLISGYLQSKNIKINDINFDVQPEFFKEFIDKIDISLISLLSEDIDQEDLENIISSLAEKTFAYYQLDSFGRKTLKDLFYLRGKYLKETVSSGKYHILKKSGATPRLFFSINEIYDFNSEIWHLTESVYKIEWLEYILKPILELPNIKTILDDYKDISLDNEKIIKIIQFWIGGNSYYEISIATGIDMDLLLKIICNLIQYHIHSIATNIINVAKEECGNIGTEVSPKILNFPTCLSLGVSSQLEIDLNNIGFVERVEMLSLGGLFTGAIEYKNKYELKMIILSNEESILESLKNIIPIISWNRIKNNIESLKNKYIF